MGYSNGIVTKPVTTKDIGQAIGSSSRKVGVLCTDSNINKWARYKPVCLPTVHKNDTFDNDTKMWGEVRSDVSTWDRPWFYGSIAYPVYIVPIISSLSDLGSNGSPNEAAIWKYNPPFGYPHAPFRMTDFLGYNHNAFPPVYVRMSDQIIINGTYDTTIEEWGTDKRSGEWEFKEILEVINTNTQVYAGIAIRNITRNVLVGYVKTEPLTGTLADYENGVFRLNPASGSPIADGGFGHKVYDNDLIDVYIFLSVSPGETDVDSMLKYSAYVDSDSECYKRYIVGHNTITVVVKYAFAELTRTIQQFISGKVYYVNDNDYGGDGSVYKVTSYIEALYGSVNIDKTPNSDYSSFRIYLSGDCIGTKSNGETFYSSAVPIITYLTKTNGNFNNENFKYTLNGTEDMKFIGYNSVRDAQSQVNGTEFIGCPIYDSIESNNVDADNVGVLSQRRIELRCSAVSSKQYYMISMQSKNDNNVVTILP